MDHAEPEIPAPNRLIFNSDFMLLRQDKRQGKNGHQSALPRRLEPFLRGEWHTLLEEAITAAENARARRPTNRSRERSVDEVIRTMDLGYQGNFVQVLATLMGPGVTPPTEETWSFLITSPMAASLVARAESTRVRCLSSPNGKILLH